MARNVALKLRIVKRKIKAKIEGRKTRNQRSCCAVSNLASLLKDGWIKAHGSGRGTFFTIDYGREVIEPK
jgi:hypothetical protein